ncbi:PP2C family protein-serine/threonine phosphatase [Gymnodinialimonas sp.]
MSATASGISYDVATALWQGARPYQEDTLLADFHGGLDRGFAILADGMGGHAAGDLASRLVVIDAASHLKFLMHDGAALEKSLTSELTSAVETANEVIKDRAADDRRLHGMGTTFLATVLFEDRLYWASVGDSPLYLWREGRLRQLNEDHSMAPVIDEMARTGEITAAEAANHPDRNALTSVLMGNALKAMDVPTTATVLDPGDVLIQASDGVQHLEEAEISRVVARGGSSREIADALMDALRDLNDETQDNTAILVLQLAEARGAVRAMATTSDTTERAVGVPLAAVDTPAPRAPTPTDVARPVGARRWVLPAGLLGAAAVAAGLVFALPALLSGPETTGFETAAVTPTVAPQPAPALITPAPSVVAPSAASTRSVVQAPEVVADAAGADTHEIVGETAPLGEEILATNTPTIIGDKLAVEIMSQVPTPARAATLEFGGETGGEALAPGANAIGLDALTPASDAVPQSEGISAPEGGVDPLLPVPAPRSERARPGDGGLSDGG